MSDVEISRTESLTRHEAAKRLASLAAALGDGGPVEIELGASRVKLHVPDHVRCEVEVEVDGDEVEFEVELKWSTAEAPPASPPASVAPEAAAKPAHARGAKPHARTRA